ncbi:MAG: hypothetical protein ACI4NM_02050 [Bullifex sp.]
MKKTFLVLLMVMVLACSVFADSYITTLDVGHSFALGKKIQGFDGGISFESKTISYIDGGFGIGSVLSAQAPLYQFKDGKVNETQNPITMGFGLFMSYKLDLTSNLSLAANAGAELSYARNKISYLEQQMFYVSAIADLSCMYSFGEVSALRFGVKGQLPFWGKGTVKLFESSTSSDVKLAFGDYYTITPYIGYSLVY